MEISLIFPHQLFEENPCLIGREVCMVEDQLYFTQFKFHKQKLLLHRASMKFYEAALMRKGFMVRYVLCSGHHGLREIFKRLSDDGISIIHYADTTDFLLEKRMARYAGEFQIGLRKYASPNFLLSSEECLESIAGRSKYLMANFYVKQRKRLNILVRNNQPVGGKWSYDKDNRKRLPEGIKIPSEYHPANNVFVKEAADYVGKKFSGNYGNTDGFFYPVNFEDAKKSLQFFLEHKFSDYGLYQDAIHQQETFLFHSLLTPALNIGLLSPQFVVDSAQEFARSNDIPLNSLEGFLRQIIGWREFVRGVYLKEGVYQRTTNFFGSTRKIPKSFYEGATGILPVDDSIRKVLKHGYCHHIERLMVLGNFMLLCEFHPDEVYRWFMELFIDAYDWVMVPNVYGMSQYADGGLITTKPYISGSNYILKMSNYKRGQWCEIWDSLFWRFIIVNRGAFENNQRMRMMVSLSDKMGRKKRQEYLFRAETFLKTI